MPDIAELIRLEEDARRDKNWKRWGPYLSERQWGTVREDYSADGDCWNYFSHEQARSRAYRWGEDGLLGLTDRECRLCFSVALWNGRDAILKERLFGLTNAQGNHGEDVKELYYYLESSPTHSWLKSLYKYPQAAYPYQQLIEQNARLGLQNREYEIEDTGVFTGDNYFDIEATYAKAGPNDILIRITCTNRSVMASTLHVVPQLWFRNTWSWGSPGDMTNTMPSLRQISPGVIQAQHETLGTMHLHASSPDAANGVPSMLFTDNDSNMPGLFGMPVVADKYYKDAFHRYIINGDASVVNKQCVGTKAGIHYEMTLGPGESRVIDLRLSDDNRPAASVFGAEFESIRKQRQTEYMEHHRSVLGHCNGEHDVIAQQAIGGLLHSKQFYHYVVREWLAGDPNQPEPPAQRDKTARNREWKSHLFNRDVISMPDKWEYPWYAAWDLAFHMIPMARVDPHFAKEQLLLLLREWYMHPSGQLPAYEFNFSDVNPPVHAWACWRVYKMTGARGQRDRAFLARSFQKLMLNFTWWVNRKDAAGKNLFGGGFLGLDNIGLFDRSQPLPTGGRLEQADGTAWMAFFCGTMLSMALELASEDPVYEDVASKFFEHYVAIVDAMHRVGGSGLWDERDGFYYDQIYFDHTIERLRVRSMVGIIPLFASVVLERSVIDKLPGFKKRLEWFVQYRSDLRQYLTLDTHADSSRLLLSVANAERLRRVLTYVLAEGEFLSPFGIRSMSKIHTTPYVFHNNGQSWSLRYTPGESDTHVFGGNSNWRGPIWFPLNYLLIEALERYDFFFGETFKIECPTGSGTMMTLRQVADELRRRMVMLFMPGEKGRRPFSGDSREFDGLLQFHEFFDGDTGRGLGANHQTGWTALVAEMIR